MRGSNPFVTDSTSGTSSLSKGTANFSRRNVSREPA